MTHSIRIAFAALCCACAGWLACTACYDVQGWRRDHATGHQGRDAAIAELTDRLGACTAPSD